MVKYPPPSEVIILSILHEIYNPTGKELSLREFIEIADKLPPLKVIHGQINDWLKKRPVETGINGTVLYLNAGDLQHRTAQYPRAVSLEAVRTALENSGFRGRSLAKARSVAGLKSQMMSRKYKPQASD